MGVRDLGFNHTWARNIPAYHVTPPPRPSASLHVLARPSAYFYSRGQDWEPFDEFTRTLFQEGALPLNLQPMGLVYDYFVDLKDNVFREWSEIVDPFSYDPDLPYSQIMVPTTDTTRFSYVMVKVTCGAGSILLVLPITSYYFLVLPSTPSVSCSWLDALNTPSSELPLSPAVSRCLPLSPTVSRFLQPV